MLELTTWLENNISNPYDAATIVEETLLLFFPDPPTQERFNYFLNDLFLYSMSADDWAIEWDNYQVTNDKTEVELILDNFFRSFLKAIELQVL